MRVAEYIFLQIQNFPPKKKTRLQGIAEKLLIGQTINNIQLKY